MDNFTQLHLHTDFSALDGIIKIPDLMPYIKELDQKYIGISDHGTIAGVWEFLKKAKEYDLTPVPGIEAYADDIFDQRDAKDRTYFHMCIWALDAQGLDDLVKISSAAWRYNFYYKPRLNTEMMQDLGKNLICTSGCMSGQFAKLVLDNRVDDAWKYLEFLKKNFHQVYMEIQPLVPRETKDGEWLLERQRIVNDRAVQAANALNLPLLATGDSHYLHKEDEDTHNTWLAIQSRKTVFDESRFKFDIINAHVKSREEMAWAFYNLYPSISTSELKEALDNSVAIGEASKVTTFKTYTRLTPQLLPEDQAFDYLCRLAAEGYQKLISRKNYEKYAARKSVSVEEAERVYKERFQYELAQIRRQGFVDYFLLVHELLSWCEGNGIYRGAARGSAASSLISYLVGITKVIDPLEYDLVFERFIAPNRISQPDIDLDFAAAQRQEVIDHIFDRWGYKNVSMIGTMITSKGKMLLQDIARAYQIPISDVNPVKSVVIQRATGDARASETLAETFEQFREAKEFDQKYPFVKPQAIKLEGCVRSYGQHAAGILITPDKLENYVPIERRKDVYASAFDGNTVEKMGFLKLDILGIDVLDLLRDIHDLVLEKRGIDIDYWNLPLDDALTLETFGKGDLLGVFQFQKSLGMANICRKAPIERFLDIVHLNALYRPGGMRSGAAEEYLNNRAGRTKIKSVHPIYDDITKDTYGIIIYQEQVMWMFSRLAGFPATRVDEGRKLIAKSHGVEAFDRLYPEFRDGCKNYSDINEELAYEFFTRIRHTGSYAFNLSHAVAYSLLSYYSQYMKVHYPAEFWTCFLNREEDADLIKQAVRYWINKYGEFLPLDINHSNEGFSIEGDKIRAGFTKLKNFTKNTFSEIQKKRPFSSFEDMVKKVEKKKVNARVQHNLLVAGAFDDLIGKDNVLSFLKMNENERIMESAEIYPSFIGVNRLDSYYDVIQSLGETYTLTSIPDLREGYRGLFLTVGIISETRFNRIGDFDKEAKNDEEKELVFKQHGWLWGSRFIDFDLDDGNEHIRLRIMPDMYDAYGDWFRNGSVLLVRGTMLPRMIKTEDGESVSTGGGIGIVSGVEYLDSLVAKVPTTPFGKNILDLNFKPRKINGVSSLMKNEDGGNFWGVLIDWKYFLRKKDQKRYGVLTFQVGSKEYKAVMWADQFEKYGGDLERDKIYQIGIRRSSTKFFDTWWSINFMKKLG